MRFDGHAKERQKTEGQAESGEDTNELIESTEISPWLSRETDFALANGTVGRQEKISTPMNKNC